MKRLFSIVLVFALVFTLAACGGNSTSQDYNVLSIEDLQAADEVHIVFWHAFGADKTVLLQELVDNFTDDYPNVTVELLSQGGYDELRDKTVKNIVTGTTPTMLIGYPDHVADYLLGKAVIPLNKFIDDEEVGFTQEDLDDFIVSYLDENRQFDGETLYGLPFNKSTEVFIYNKTYFEANELDVPTTWDEVETTAQFIKNDTGEFGFAYDSTSNAFITLTRQWGGDYTASDGSILFNNDQAIAALSFYEDMKEAGIATIPGEWEQNYASEPFKNELVYMTVGSTAGIAYNVPASGAFDIGVAPIPQHSDSTKAVIQQGTNISIMSNSTDLEKLAAWLLLKELTSTESTVFWSMLTGYLPVRTSGYESDTYQTFLAAKDNPLDPDYYTSLAANAAYLQKDYMFYDPAFVGSSRAREEVGLALSAALLGGKTATEAIQEAYDNLT